MCVVRTNDSSSVCFLSLHLFPVILERAGPAPGQVGTRIPNLGALAPSRGVSCGCSLAALVSRPETET